MNGENAIVVREIVKPLVSAVEAKQNWEAYLELKRVIMDASDVQKIEGKDFLKKSYWRKVKTFFNISLTVNEEKRADLPNGDFAYHFTVRATANNGVYVDGTGSCTAFEDAYRYNDSAKRFEKPAYKWNESTKHKDITGWDEVFANSEHNVRSTAETRAKNRAISDLVGGGDVSAEEVHRSYNDKSSAPTTTAPTNPSEQNVDMSILDQITPFKTGNNVGKTWREVGGQGVHALKANNDKNPTGQWFKKNDDLFSSILQALELEHAGIPDLPENQTLPPIITHCDVIDETAEDNKPELSEFEKFTRQCVEICLILGDGKFIFDTKKHLDIPLDWKMADTSENNFKLETFNNMIMAEIKKRGIKL